MTEVISSVSHCIWLYCKFQGQAEIANSTITQSRCVFLLSSLACAGAEETPGNTIKKADLNQKQRQRPPLTSSLEFSLLRQVCALPHPGSIIKVNNHLRCWDPGAHSAYHRDCVSAIGMTHKQGLKHASSEIS